MLHALIKDILFLYLFSFCCSMFISRLRRVFSVAFLQSVFNSSRATWVCCLAAIAAKSLIAWTYTDLVADKSLYLLFAHSFLETGIFAEPVLLIGKSSPVYLFNPAIYSPLYSLLAVPFLWITKSYFATQFILSVLGWTLFFTALYRVVRVFFHVRWLANLFILLTGFFLYPHELESTPKDTLAAAFTLWSIFFASRFIRTKPGVQTTTCLALSLACLCLTKLIYVPVAPVLLLLLLVFTIEKKDKGHFIQYGFLLSLLFFAGVMVTLWIFHPAIRLFQPDLASINRNGEAFIRGLYPENLLEMYPFLSSALINTNFLGVQLEQLLHIPFGKIMAGFRILDAFVLGALLFLFLFRYRRVRPGKPVILLLTTSVMLIGFVVYLSLTYASFSSRYSAGNWTYVEDARSFLVPMIAFQLLLFAFVFRSGKPVFLRKAVFVLFLFESVHGVYFTIKQVSRIGQAESRQAGAINQITVAALQLKKSDEKVSIVTTDNILRRYAMVKGLKAYAVTNELSASRAGNRFLFVTHLQDSALRNAIAIQGQRQKDTISPFVLQYYP